MHELKRNRVEVCLSFLTDGLFALIITSFQPERCGFSLRVALMSMPPCPKPPIVRLTTGLPMSPISFIGEPSPKLKSRLETESAISLARDLATQ